MQQNDLLDHLAGAGEKRGRDFEAERLRSTNVDDKLERGRLRDSQVGGPGALENSARVGADLAVRIWIIRAIGHESTGCGEFAPIVNRWNCVPCRERNDSVVPAVKKRVRGYKERPELLA
jgi:hypothetical protein